MSLQLPNYAHPYNAAPAPQAYGYITTLSMDFGAGACIFQVDVWEDENSCNAGKQRCDTVPLALGATYPASDPANPAVTLSTLAELLSKPDFAAAWETVRGYMYAEALKHPKLASGVQVP